MTGRAKFVLVGLAIVVGLAWVGPAWAATAPTSQAKDIFYNPAEVPVVPGQPPPPQPPVQIALNYRILLWRNCQLYQVPPTFVFRTGDKFRIAFQSNMDGCLNIFHKGSTGKTYKLFPDPRINGGSNQISKYSELVVPSAGWFEFDPVPGPERLYLFLSPKPIGALNFGGQQVIPTATWSQATAPYFKQVKAAQQKGQTKDIVFVDEGQTVTPPPPPPGQTVAPPPNTNPQMFVATQIAPQVPYDPMLIHDLTLIHR